MNNDNVIEFKPPGTTETFTDALTALIQQGAQQIIAQAVEAELQTFLEQCQHLRDEQGRKAVVRNGYLARAHHHPWSRRSRGTSAESTR